MRTHHVAWALGGGCHLVYVQAGSIAGQHGTFLHGGVQALEYLLLEIEILIHGLHHHIGIGDGVVVQHAFDQRHPLVALRCADAAAAHHARVVVGDYGKPFIERFLALFQHLHRNARIREAHRDAAAHQAAAHRGSVGDGPFGRCRGDIRYPRRLPFGEEHMDHRRALLVIVTALEVGAFGADALVEVVDLHRRPHGVERHLAVELATHPPCEIRLASLEHSRIGAICFDLVAAMPHQRMRAAGGSLGFGEGDGAGHQIGGDDLVDDAEREGFFGVERIAAQDCRHGAFSANQPWQALRAATARQQADLDFRQAHRRTRCRNAVVAGERKFQAAPECGAVDCRHHGLGARLDEGAGWLFGLFVRVRRLAEVADVGAGDERSTFAGDDDRFDGCVAERGFEMLREVEAHA